MKPTTESQKRAVQTLAENLLAEHGLHNWRAADHTDLDFLLSATVLGICWQDQKTIYLKLARLARFPRAKQQHIILHEIAHALTPTSDHDLEWAACAERIGVPLVEIITDLGNVAKGRAKDAPAAQIAFDTLAPRLRQGNDNEND